MKNFTSSRNASKNQESRALCLKIGENPLMDWSSMHFSYASENIILGKMVREFGFEDENEVNRGRIIAEFSEDRDSADFRVETSNSTAFSWRCSERENANFCSGSYFCVIDHPSTGWSHKLDVPIQYHVPHIYVFDDGSAQFRLAKVGKRFGEFFVIDQDEKAHEWIAGFDKSFFAMMRVITCLATLTLWRPKYYQPLTGSSALGILAEPEQRKAVILAATIRMFLDGNDFSTSH